MAKTIGKTLCLERVYLLGLTTFHCHNTLLIRCLSALRSITFGARRGASRLQYRPHSWGLYSLNSHLPTVDMNLEPALFHKCKNQLPITLVAKNVAINGFIVPRAKQPRKAFCFALWERVRNRRIYIRAKVWYNKRGQILVHNLSTKANTEPIWARKSCVWEMENRYLWVVFCAADTGNNPMVGMTVACAVAVEEAMK